MVDTKGFSCVCVCVVVKGSHCVIFMRILFRSVWFRVAMAERSMSCHGNGGGTLMGITGSVRRRPISELGTDPSVLEAVAALPPPRYDPGNAALLSDREKPTQHKHFGMSVLGLVLVYLFGSTFLMGRA